MQSNSYFLIGKPNNLSQLTPLTHTPTNPGVFGPLAKWTKVDSYDGSSCSYVKLTSASGGLAAAGTAIMVSTSTAIPLTHRSTHVALIMLTS